MTVKHTMGPESRRAAHDALDKWLETVANDPTRDEDGEGHKFELRASLDDSASNEHWEFKFFEVTTREKYL